MMRDASAVEGFCNCGRPLPIAATPTPFLLGVGAAADALGISRSKLEYLIARHEIGSLKVGRRRLLTLAGISAFITEREAEAEVGS